MVSITSRLQLIGHASTFSHRAFGFTVTSLKTDKYSYIAQLSNGREDLQSVITVTSVDDKDEKFIITTLTNALDDQCHTKSVLLNYSEFCQNIALPISDHELDQLIMNHNNSWKQTLPGHLMSFSTGFDEPKTIPDDQLNSLFEDTIIPRFKKQYDDKRISSTQQKIIESLFGGTPEIKTTSVSSQPKPLPEAIPKFDDEYEVSRPQKNDVHDPSRIPSIGDADRNPIGGRYPVMKPYLDPNFQTPSGMILDKNHPLFQNPSGSSNGQFNPGPRGSRFDNPFGTDVDDDSVGMGLPSGSFKRGFNGPGGPFGGNGASGGFPGGFPGGGFI